MKSKRITGCRRNWGREAVVCLTAMGVLGSLGCSGSDSNGSGNATGGAASSNGGVSSTGGAIASTGGDLAQGGKLGTGGAPSTGSDPLTGGSSSTGGKANAGGSISMGGTVSSGGNTLSGSTGGSSANGGSLTTGGSKGTGGSATNGGSATTGGNKNSGGSATTGGSKASGGTMAAAGATATGGTKATGGTATGGLASTGGTTSTGGACTYYIDAASGNDTNAGTTTAAAWKTLTKVNGTTFQPGNIVCFKAGGSWSGQLWPKGSGTSAAPIIIDQYGTGAKPIIAAGSSDADAVHLANQQYWEINNLEVTNKKSALGDYRGISINGQNAGTLNHIYIRKCFVHDVTGQVNWIGGDIADNLPGVTFQTGWDASKKTGGIVFDVQAGTGTAVKTRFNDVLVEGNTVQDCSFGGIIFKQLDGTVHWGTRNSTTDTTWTPHTNVVIRGNYLSQLNTSYGCNTIYMTNVQTGLIEQNVTNGAGTSAIELYYTDGVIIQKNETLGTVRKANGADWNGIDTDNSTTNTTIQYNYIHDNGDGILLCQFSFGSSIVRYNVIQNNSRYQIYLHSDPAATSSIYNNTVYNNKTNSGVVYGYGTSITSTYALRNNIFFAASGNGVLTTSSTITYQKNLYFGAGIQVPASDATPVTADPRLLAPGTGTSGGAAGPAFASLDGYKLQTGSPAINTGLAISTNGGLDFWGQSLNVGATDIGAYEAR